MRSVEKILAVVRLAERLKRTLRHSGMSDGRQERVAEHGWRMAWMALVVSPHLDVTLHAQRLRKMVIAHALFEASAGNVPAFALLGDGVAKALDKPEARIQHNEACLST